MREQFFVKLWWPLFRSHLGPFSLHSSPRCFQCEKQTLSRKQFVNSLLPSSWDFWALEMCGAEGRQGREHGKNSSLVNSDHSNLVFDFWMNAVTCAVLELPLKDLLYGYPWQTYISKHVLKEFHTDPFTLVLDNVSRSKVTWCSHSPDTDGTWHSREMEKLLSVLLQLVCHRC